MTPRRIQRRRTRGWRMPRNTVYVGRPTKWSNPFTVGREHVRERMEPGGGEKAFAVADADHAARLYRRFLTQRLRIHAKIELRGKNLACWCPPGQPCHADVLLELASRDRGSGIRDRKGRASLIPDPCRLTSEPPGAP